MRWQRPKRCSFCGSSLTKRIDTGRIIFGRPLFYRGCDICGLITMCPRPDPDDYTELFMNGTIGAKAHQMLQIEHSFDGLLDWLLQFPEKKERLYDIGCGLGTLVKQAREREIEASGNDINLYNVAYANLGIELRPTYRLNLKQDYYDIIVMKSYLGHSFYPYQELCMCYNALRDGGILFYRGSYVEGLNSLLSPELELDHISYFTFGCLWEMIYEAGFNFVRHKYLEPARKDLYMGKLNIIAKK